MPSKALIIVVASFLLVILIYSSVAKMDVFANRKVSQTCGNVATTLKDATSAQMCCTTTIDYDKKGRIIDISTQCQTCEYDSSGTVIDCRSKEVRTMGNSTNLPNRLGTALPTGNNTGAITNGQTGLPSRLGNALPPGNSTSIFNPVRNVTSALPVNNNTGTPPPVSIIKVPPGTIGSATNPPTNNNTGNPIAMTSSDNPPGCSKKIPIPPNCTLNPFNNSASNKAGTVGSATNPSNNTGTASLGNIIKVPVNHTNALPTNNTTGTPLPALKSSQPSLAGQQPQTQQATGHHHKGSSTGASTSTGNSTGH